MLTQVKLCNLALIFTLKAILPSLFLNNLLLLILLSELPDFLLSPLPYRQLTIHLHTILLTSLPQQLCFGVSIVHLQSMVKQACARTTQHLPLIILIQLLLITSQLLLIKAWVALLYRVMNTLLKYVLKGITVRLDARIPQFTVCQRLQLTHGFTTWMPDMALLVWDLRQISGVVLLVWMEQLFTQSLLQDLQQVSQMLVETKLPQQLKVMWPLVVQHLMPILVLP